MLMVLLPCLELASEAHPARNLVKENLQESDLLSFLGPIGPYLLPTSGYSAVHLQLYIVERLHSL